jgi:hypothetical protein
LGWLVTILVSIYALSGRQFLANEKLMAETWTDLDAQVETLEDKTFPTPALPITEKSTLYVTPLCELGRRNRIVCSLLRRRNATS